jgi:aminomethyltransferase
VLDGDGAVGRVLSGTLSPMRNEAIGSALVASASAASAALAVDVRGQRVPLSLCKPPFVTLPKQA